MNTPTSPLQPLRILQGTSPEGRPLEPIRNRPRPDAPAEGPPCFAASPPPGADAPAAPEATGPREVCEFVLPWRDLWLPDDFEDELDFPAWHDDAGWDAFLTDDDEPEPLPEPGDFWIENDHEAPVDAGRRPRRVA